MAIADIDYYRGLRWQAWSLGRPFVWKYFTIMFAYIKFPRFMATVYCFPLIIPPSVLNKTSQIIVLSSVTICLCFRFLVSYRLLIYVFSFASVLANRDHLAFSECFLSTTTYVSLEMDPVVFYGLINMLHVDSFTLLHYKVEYVYRLQAKANKLTPQTQSVVTLAGVSHRMLPVRFSLFSQRC